MAVEGKGATVTFGTFSGNVERIGMPTFEAAEIPTTHLGTSDGWKTSQSSGVYDPGEVTLEVQYSPSVNLPKLGDSGTMTITFPDTETATASVWVRSVEQPSMANEEKMMTTIVFRVTGKMTLSWE